MAWWALVVPFCRTGRGRPPPDGLPGKLSVKGLNGDLGRDLAVEMAAHAVGHDHQQRVAGIAVGDPIFVVGAAAWRLS